MLELQAIPAVLAALRTATEPTRVLTAFGALLNLQMDAPDVKAAMRSAQAIHEVALVAASLYTFPSWSANDAAWEAEQETRATGTEWAYRLILGLLDGAADDASVWTSACVHGLLTHDASVRRRSTEVSDHYSPTLVEAEMHIVELMAEILEAAALGMAAVVVDADIKDVLFPAVLDPLAVPRCWTEEEEEAGHAAKVWTRWRTGATHLLAAIAGTDANLDRLGPVGDVDIAASWFVRPLVTAVQDSDDAGVAGGLLALGNLARDGTWID